MFARYTNGLLQAAFPEIKELGSRPTPPRGAAVPRESECKYHFDNAGAAVAARVKIIRTLFPKNPEMLEQKDAVITVPDPQTLFLHVLRQVSCQLFESDKANVRWNDRHFDCNPDNYILARSTSETFIRFCELFENAGIHPVRSMASPGTKTTQLHIPLSLEESAPTVPVINFPKLAVAATKAANQSLELLLWLEGQKRMDLGFVKNLADDFFPPVKERHINVEADCTITITYPNAEMLTKFQRLLERELGFNPHALTLDAMNKFLAIPATVFFQANTIDAYRARSERAEIKGTAPAGAAVPDEKKPFVSNEVEFKNIYDAFDANLFALISRLLASKDINAQNLGKKISQCFIESKIQDCATKEFDFRKALVTLASALLIPTHPLTICLANPLTEPPAQKKKGAAAGAAASRFSSFSRSEAPQTSGPQDFAAALKAQLYRALSTMESDDPALKSFGDRLGTQ